MIGGCRVALVNPDFSGSFHGTPLGLAYLGAALGRAGHGVKIFDFCGDGKTSEEQAREVLKYGPDVVGVTSTSPSLPEALQFMTSYRRLDPDAWLVKGGPHERQDGDDSRLALAPEDWEEPRPAEFVITAANGERPLVQLVEARARGVLWRQVESIAGVKRRVMAGPSGPVTEVLGIDGNLPPARHLLDRPERYHYRGIFGERKGTQMLTYRGCRFNCSFCAISNLEFQHAEASVEADISTIKEMGYEAVFLDDATFTLQWDRAERVARLLQKAGLIWACQTRIDCVTPEHLKVMRETGCHYIYYGLESGSSRVQAAIHKKQHYQRTIDTVRLTRELGMMAVTSFIFGVPLPNGDTEGEEDWARSVALIHAARPNHVVPALFAYYPQSPAWRDLASNRKDAYYEGPSRDPKWNWFDDGFGSLHHVDLDRALEIRSYLEREIPEFLWADDAGPKTDPKEMHSTAG